MSKSPSLRELRRKLPDNVIILPTAAQRQVQQRFGRGYGIAKEELLASQTIAFPYRLPGTREEDARFWSTELRADVPPFDPTNPRHLRTWEAYWDARQTLRSLDKD